MARRRTAALLALAAYVAAAVWLTWPLAEHLDTHLPEPHVVARFDALYAAWVLAWETHALTTEPTRLTEANIYHPTPHALFYGPASFGALPWFAPTYLWTGNPARATNLMFLASLALTAWTLHLALLGFTGSHAAGVVAASALLTNRWLLWLAPTAPNYTVLQYWPLIILLAAWPTVRLRWLVPLVVLQVSTDPVYVGVDVLVPLGVLALGRLARASTRASGVRLAAGLALAVLCLAPIYAGYAVVRAANPDFATQTVHRAIPSLATTAWLGFVHTPASIAGVALLLIPLGLLAGAQTGPSGLAGPAWRHGALWSLSGLFLALPAILPRGTLSFPSWELLVSLGFRVPARLAIGAMFGLAILAGAGFAACVRPLYEPGRRPAARTLVRGLLAALVVWAIHAEYHGSAWHPIFSRAPVPAAYPLFPVPQPDPELMRVIHDTPGPLLELPLGPEGTQAVLHADSMYRSTYHWRPLLNGYSSYWPAGFAQRMQLASLLPDPDALAALRAETGLTMVLLRWRLLNPAEQARWVHIAAKAIVSPLQPVIWKDDGLLLVIRDEGSPE